MAEVEKYLKSTTNGKTIEKKYINDMVQNP